jgi:hypothetical protein
VTIAASTCCIGIGRTTIGSRQGRVEKRQRAAARQLRSYRDLLL